LVYDRGRDETSTAAAERRSYPAPRGRRVSLTIAAWRWSMTAANESLRDQETDDTEKKVEHPAADGQGREPTREQIQYRIIDFAELDEQGHPDQGGDS
jgi:hypothetical protein